MFNTQYNPVFSGGGNDPKPAPRLSFSQMREWNSHVQNAPKGIDKLEDLYRLYQAKNPHGSIPIEALRNELSLAAKDSDRLAQKNGQIIREGNHTGNVFPSLIDQNGSNRGPVNGNGMVENSPTQVAIPSGLPSDANKLPTWVNYRDIQLDPQKNLPFYKDGEDMIFVHPSLMHRENWPVTRLQGAPVSATDPLLAIRNPSK